MRWLAAALLAACSSDPVAVSDRQLPDQATLCKVVVGYENTNGMVFLGTHADDVRAVLGEPTSQTATKYTYDWCADAACTKHVSAVVSLSEMAYCYRNSGKPITPPYWVTGVEVTGFKRPQCWVMGSEKSDSCSECLARGEVAGCNE